MPFLRRICPPRLLSCDNVACSTNGDLTHCGSNIRCCDLATGPSYPNSAGPFTQSEHLHAAVLRPIAAAGMNFPGRTESLSIFQSHHRADAIRIPCRAVEPHAQPWFGALVPKQFRGAAILGHGQIHSTVPVEVA